MATDVVARKLAGFSTMPPSMPRPAFLARYDTAALRPPAPLARPQDWYRPEGAWASAYARLRQWCLEGTGMIDAVPASPRQGRHVPLAVAEWMVEEPAIGARLVEALCQDLDGSVRMAACSGSMARLGLRLQVKINDCLGWRQRRSDDPWDSGYTSADPQAVSALGQFRPRRPTLIIAPGLSAPAAAAVITALTTHQREFVCPVRLLLVDMAAMDEAARTALDALRGTYAIAGLSTPAPDS